MRDLGLEGTVERWLGRAGGGHALRRTGPTVDTGQVIVLPEVGGLLGACPWPKPRGGHPSVLPGAKLTGGSGGHPGSGQASGGSVEKEGRSVKTSPQFWMRLQADWDLHEAVRRAAGVAS